MATRPRAPTPKAQPTIDELIARYLADRPSKGLHKRGAEASLVLGRRGAAWDILEVGKVYPETLA